MQAFLLLFPVLSAGADPLPLDWDIQRAHQVQARELSWEVIEITTLGVDPFLPLQPFAPSRVTAEHRVLAFEYFCPDEIHGLDVYYGPPFTADRRLSAGTLGRAESWMPHAIDLVASSEGKWDRRFLHLRLDFGQRAGRTLRIRNVVLREPTAEELRSLAEREAEKREKLEREARVNAFYQASFPARVESVAVSAERVTVRGWLGEGVGSARLLVIAPEVSSADLVDGVDTVDGGDKGSTGFLLKPVAGIRGVAGVLGPGVFRVTVPRRVGVVDRTTFRWAVAEPVHGGGWKLLSHWKYATDLSAAAPHDLPPLEAKGIKGMGGVDPRFPLEELVQLGVRHITLNVSLTPMLSVEPRAGWERFEHAGRTWYVNPGQVAYLDRLTTFARDRDIVCTGILLVNFADSAFGKLLIHPEAHRAGHYAMPNLTSAEGVATYEAVLEFLASRYAAPGAPHGRISNWIVHNEVGYGWEWTNMGEQPPMLYMDHYLRSMRLAHNVVRRHDPHARVFISLTHHWNTPSAANWRSYSNRDLLERLMESSRVEGDFAWGVAFHPYPQSLWKADAWNDTRVTDDFDTPLITPKNLSVLDRWMHRPEMGDRQGRVRGLLLSEQGLHSPDYSPEGERLQAAGLVYMWRQMQGLKSIETFQYHRWVDHPNEGGLLLGLRRLPSEGTAYGEKKLSWEIYRALGTDAEAEGVRELEGWIGR